MELKKAGDLGGEVLMSEQNDSTPVIEINILDSTGQPKRSITVPPEKLTGSRKGFEGITADLFGAVSQENNGE